LKEDYNRVAARALEVKKAKVLEEWFNEHITNYYINIDEEYQPCSEIKAWTKVANAIIKQKSY
jgi:peptidyl-prolyl cis-trans isomerase SurA